MFSDRPGFRTFWKVAEGGVNRPRPAKRTLWLAGLLVVLSSILPGQSTGILNVTEFVIPSAGSGVQQITAGPDGAIWFTEPGISTTSIGKIGRISPSGSFTEYSVAALPGAGNAEPNGITTGPDGALWFTLTLGIGRITTAGVVTEFSIPGGGVNQGFPQYITAGPDGALWFTDPVSFSVGRISTSGQVTEYKLPNTPLNNTLGPGPSLRAITSGPDGALWFIEAGNGAIGRITTAGSITQYSVPNLATAVGNCIIAGPDGALWFSDGNQSVGRITTSGILSEFPVGASPVGITVGPDGAIWLNGSGIERITTAGVLSQYTTSPPSGGSSITLGPDGALWFSDSNHNAIARILVPTRTGVLSHIAAGGWWNTVITLINTSSAALPVTVALHNDDGTALTLPVTTTQQGASQTTTTSSVNATINPNATLLISMGNQVASTVVGWADVTSVGPLGGYAIFRQTPQTGSPSEGTVPLQSQFPSTVTLPYDNTAGFVMGVALANLSTSTASITATMWDDSGNLLGTQIITIAGNGHSSFVLPNQLALTAGRRGIVKFQSAANGGITGLGLRFSPFGTFTSVPTM
jgi:virginiamycin B lyase